jgi:hypothetical protein
VTARTDDYDEIVRVMLRYIDAFNDNDVARLKESFDGDAWIFYIDAGGSLHKHPISDDFERWAARGAGTAWRLIMQAGARGVSSNACLHFQRRVR